LGGAGTHRARPGGAGDGRGRAWDGRGGPGTARDAHGTALVWLGRHGTRMGQHGTHMGHLMGIIKGRCTGHSFPRRAFTWDILGVKSRHMGQRSSHARNTLLSFGTSWDLYVPISTEPSTC